MLGLRAHLKEFLQTWIPPAMSWGSWVIAPGHTAYDYGREIGDGLNSSVLMAVIFWLCRAAPEAQLVVRERKRGADEPAVVAGHPLVTLVERPNDYYAGDALWMSTMWSWCIFGNAYWRIVATRGGEPRELWWIPPWQIMPATTTTSREFISHYRYTPEGAGATVIELPRDQVLHFRHGLDPRNPRLGLSPLYSVMREIWTDNESTEWVAALLRNMAVPGLVISPKGESTLSPDEVTRVKAYISSRFTGDHRGEPMALGAATDVQKISHNPSEMDLSVVHNTAEERVCSIYGVPAAVIGFGTGLENSKVGATMREFVGLAWSNGLIPPQRIMAAELERNLLPRFETRLDRFGVGWDYSAVLALQEDEGTRLTRYNLGVQGGWIKVSEARNAMNLPTTPDDEIYLRSNSVQAVDPTDQLPPEPLPMPAPLRGLPERTEDDGEGEEQDEREEETEEAAEYAEGYRTKQGTVEELIQSIMARRNTRVANPPRWLVHAAARMEREHRAMRRQAQAMILPVLHRMGVRMSAVAREVLQPKQSLSDLIATSVIIDQAPMAQFRVDLSQVYEAMYDLIAIKTIDTLREVMELEPLSAVELQQLLHVTAVERVRAIDLPAEFRRDLLRIFDQAGKESWTEDQIIDAIQEEIPSGHWRDARTRARVVARTETRFAQNIATSHWTHRAGLTHLMAVDARLGPTDETCELRNHQIVTVEESRMLSGIEHPNGTLGFVPLSSSILSEMGVTV